MADWYANRVKNTEGGPVHNAAEGTASEQNETYITTAAWRPDRPHVLVVACSDGRYQEALDEFLGNRLGIFDYDRLYAPGGPGALIPSVISYFRGIHFQEEARFLMDAHQLERVILIVHGPVVSEGPREAMCADYLRKMPGNSAREVRSQQAEDLRTVTNLLQRAYPHIQIQLFVAEVRQNRTVQFVALPLLPS